MPNQKNIDMETVIVNLMREEQKEYLPISRLQNLIEYIYQQLIKQEHPSGLEEIELDASFDVVERTVQHNNNIFVLVGTTIYLKTPIDKINERYQEDYPEFASLTNLIQKFCAAT